MPDQVKLMTKHPSHPLKDFYTRVFNVDPVLAARISNDVLEVALNNPSFGRRSQEGQASAERLREMATEMPDATRSSLETALTFLGYS